MKKLLVLSIILTIVPSVNATPYITVDGEDPGSEITIQPGDYIWLGPYLEFPHLCILEISGGIANGDWTGENNLYYPDIIVCDPVPGEENCGVWEYEPEYDSWLYNWSGSFTGVVADAELHCTSEGNVTISLYDESWEVVDTLTIHQSSEPWIGFNPPEISFYGTEGGGDPVDQTLSVYNDGATGVLNWEITESCDWLQVNPNSGISADEPNEVTISVDITGLAGGIYNCDVVISDPCASNSPQTVPVTLLVYDGDGVLHVPSEYGTIQEAIDLARENETVLVAEGTYLENISFAGKNITVKSTDPNDWDIVEVTIIDGGGIDTGVRFNGTETSDCKLLGFTITNGYGPADSDGGGITGASTNATIAKCIISDNLAQKNGGGIRKVNGLIDRCIITGNSTVNQNAGGITGCHGTISNCLIYNNTATLAGGGMVYCNGDIVNCTIVDNTAGDGTGGMHACNGTITNCIIWDNSGTTSDQLTGSATYPTATPTYSCIQNWSGGGEGNISINPEFVNPATDNYHLPPWPYCTDAGTNSPPSGLPATDLDGIARPIDGENDGQSIADMGCYESLASEEPVIWLGTEGPVLIIRNSGGGTLNWLISAGCSWVLPDPNSGTSTSEPNEVNFYVDTSGLDYGHHECTLTISDPCALNSPRYVILGIDIAMPVIELSTSQFEFFTWPPDPGPDDQFLEISNSGDGTLYWDITCPDCNWLDIDPTSGSSIGEADQVTLSVDANGLPFGEYGCELTISDPCASNNPQTVQVDLFVECMPADATTADPVGLALNDSPEANGSTTYAEWVAAGRPECWCYQAQCRGNADGISNGSSKTGYYLVGTFDLHVLQAAWGVYEPPVGPGAANVTTVEGVPAICANFNRMLNGSSKTGYYHVGTDDLSRLIASWGVYQPPAGPGIPLDDCGGNLINPGDDFPE